MADLIKIIPEMVKEEAKKIRNYREEHDDVMDRLGNLVTNLCDIWEGQAYESFVSSYMEIEKKIAKFSEMLGKYATGMEESANAMQAADQALKSKINGLV